MAMDHRFLRPMQTEISRICPTITPTLGSELVADPGLEANYTAGLCDTLAKTGAPTLAQSADVHGGSKAQSFTATAQNDNVKATGISIPNNAWLRASIWGKRSVGTGGTVSWRFYNGATFIYPRSGGSNVAFTDATYTQKIISFLTGGTGGQFDLARDSGAASWDTVVVDDYSLKQLSNTTVYVGKRSKQNGTYTCTPTAVVDSQVGFDICWLDANNFVRAIVDRGDGKAKLYKCIADVYTLLTSGNIVYGDGEQLSVIVSGTTFKLYYKGVQVGSNQTISDTLGLQVYGFSTHASSSVGHVTTTPATS